MTSGDSTLLSAHFDCVVMLTSSDWHSRPPRHHYPYAIRFAQYLPVVLVQPVLNEASFKYENTEIDGIVVLHVYQTYGSQQRNLLNKALLERRYLKPLLWVVNPMFINFIIHRYAPLKIFYALDDYLAPDFVADHGKYEQIKSMLQKILSHTNLLIATTENTIKNCVNTVGYSGETAILTSREDIKSSDTESYEHIHNNHFNLIVSKINSSINTKTPEQHSLNILILYDDQSTHITTVREYLESFSLFSRSKISYAFATHNSHCLVDLSIFDVIVIHYSIRLSLTWHLSPSYAKALKQFGGYKILYIQDEYDNTETARRWIESLGIHAVFSCVPQRYIELAYYPSSRFPYTEFITVLAGYVSPALENFKPKPLSERKLLIGYRGRNLAYFYGNLAREKTIIAQKMREICEARNLPVDIEWDDSKRIYGDKWYNFIENCKTTLGTEGGANIFDDYGDIRRNVEKALKENSDITYEEIHQRYLAEHEGKIIMNQISPRIFEAIALRTALVLFEGEYSGIIKPDLHYIPLKKDLSNVDDVLAKLQDDSYLKQLTERAYADIIKPGKYSYQQFIQDFDRFLSERRVKTAGASYITAIVADMETATGTTELVKFYEDPVPKPRYSFSTPLPLQQEQTVAFGNLVTVHSIIISLIKTIIESSAIIINSAYLILYSLRHKDKIISNGEYVSIRRDKVLRKLGNFMLVNLNRTLNFIYARAIRKG